MDYYGISVLNYYLLSFGFVQNAHDPCALNLKRNGAQLSIEYHTDDGFQKCSNYSNMCWLHDDLHSNFKATTAKKIIGLSEPLASLKFIRINRQAKQIVGNVKKMRKKNSCP